MGGIMYTGWRNGLVLIVLTATGCPNSISETPRITTEALPDGLVGQDYLVLLSGIPGPGVWHLQSGQLPPGLSLNDYGHISGTPSTPGTFPFQVRFFPIGVDPLNATRYVDGDFSITIGEPLAITTGSPLPSGIVATAYSTRLAASGGPPGSDKTWNLAAGSTLPPGLTLNPTTGDIAGAPSAAGTYGFTVEVTAGGKKASKAFRLDVLWPPVVITTGFKLPDGTVDQAYSTSLSSTGGDGTYAYSISSGTLPPGLTLSAAGVIAGTPTAAAADKTYSFEVTVASGGRGDFKSFEITVHAAACSFSITPTSKTFTSAGGPGTVGVTGTSGCSWTATVSPSAPWITITSGATGTGNGGVGYSVTTNPTGLTRVGTITIAGQTFTVTQSP